LHRGADIDHLGRHGSHRRVGLCAGFAKKISGPRIEMIERAGHLPQLEQPDAVLKVLSGFLAG
jgi:pimeloyl-ACP methyl ester carboxylesterase